MMREYSNGISAGREGSRWKDERIAELEAERRELAELLAEARTTIDAFGYGLAKRQAAEAGHHTRKRMNSLLAKIDAQRGEGG